LALPDGANDLNPSAQCRDAKPPEGRKTEIG